MLLVMREERVVVCMCEVCNREKGGTEWIYAMCARAGL